MSSSNEIKTIIPATAENNNPKIVSLKNGRKIKYPTIAPIGSVIPERNEIINAFFFLPVEKYIGRDVAIPSGMLCIAIAIAIAVPRYGSFKADVKVAIPSGKLCIAIARAVITPIRLSVFGLFVLPMSFSVDGMKKSINAIKIIPAKNAITHNQFPDNSPFEIIR